MYTVLVVENNQTILKLLSHHLEAKGCTVITATDGLAALLELETFIPDIMLTDIIMPRVSGDQLCSIVRGDARLKDLFIAVHSSTLLEDNRQILDLDADVYIAKGPVINIKEHVHHVLSQYEKGIRRDKKTIGEENLYPREITKELLLARKHYQAIFNNISEAVVEMDKDGKIIQINNATEKLLGRYTLDILSHYLTDFLDENGRHEVVEWIATYSQTGATSYQSSYNAPLSANGRQIQLKLVAIPENGNFFLIGILQDITIQKNTEKELAKTLSEFNAVIETIDYGVLFMDENQRARIVNQAYRDLWKVPRELTDTHPSMKKLMQFVNHNSGIYDYPPSQIADYIEERIKEIENGEIPPTELRHTDGKVLRYQCVELPDNGRLLTYYDITSLKQTEEKLAEALEKVSNLANHDALTNLPNLRLAREKLLSALSLSKRKGWMAAILFIDLDGFKEVNDSHGHEIGDKVLQEVAKRLVSSLRQADTVARIGGDEFLVIQTEVHHRFATANVAEKIVSTIAQPFIIDAIEIKIGASIGIALYPENGEDSKTLMKKADDAMYYTKRIGKNSYTFTPG